MHVDLRGEHDNLMHDTSNIKFDDDSILVVGNPEHSTARPTTNPAQPAYLREARDPPGRPEPRFVLENSNPAPMFVRSEQPRVDWQAYYQDRMKWMVDRGLRKVDVILDSSEVGKTRGMAGVPDPPPIPDPDAPDIAALDTTAAKVRELEEERGGILNTFDGTVNSMYQRFPATDDTVYLLEAVTTAIRGIMEWHKVFSELHISQCADIRNAAQQSIVGLCLAVRCVVENIRHHVSVINQEFRGYTISFDQFKEEFGLESLSGTKFEPVRNLRDKYVEFLHKVRQHADEDVITRASLDMLQSQNDDKLLFAMRTIMIDVQKYIDENANAKPSRPGAPRDRAGLQSRRDRGNSIMDQMEQLRAQKKDLQTQIETLNRKLLSQWSRANWNSVKELQQSRNELKDSVAQLDKEMQQIASTADDVAESLKDVDFEEMRMDFGSLATEHRYKFLNEIIRLTEEFRLMVVSAEPKTVQPRQGVYGPETYFRLNDVLEDETQLALCRLRTLGTEELYSAGIEWAQKFNGQVADITNQSNNMERFLRDQKRHLDDVLAQQKRRLIMRNASVADLDMSRLQSLAAQYADLCGKYTKMRIAAEDAYAAEDLEKRMCPLK